MLAVTTSFLPQWICKVVHICLTAHNIDRGKCKYINLAHVMWFIKLKSSLAIWWLWICLKSTFTRVHKPACQYLEWWKKKDQYTLCPELLFSTEKKKNFHVYIRLNLVGYLLFILLHPDQVRVTMTPFKWISSPSTSLQSLFFGEMYTHQNSVLCVPINIITIIIITLVIIILICIKLTYLDYNYKYVY